MALESCTNCTTLPSHTNPDLVAWISEPDGSGTLGLLTTTLSIIFLRAWVVIHPRLNRSQAHATWHNLALLAKTLLAPELIAVESLQKWAQCRGMVQDCNALSYGEFKPIQDKKNRDSITKPITLHQVLWFIATCIMRVMRAANGLPLSQLERMTLSYFPLSGITYFFRWEKPKDIFSPSIFDETKVPATYWSILYITPRVFEKEDKDREEQLADARALERAASDMSGSETTIYEAPAQKEIVVAHWDPYLYRSKITRLLCSLFGASFKWMWRGSAFISIFSLLVFMHFEKAVLRCNGLITIIQTGSPALYFVSRILMLGEVFAALRAADPRVYDTYEVGNYGFHL
ncbi:hypothetical protein BDW69DRAFT_198697 [Aspergillus filifer]